MGFKIKIKINKKFVKNKKELHQKHVYSYCQDM
jgi:hypothetical protein